MAYIPYISIIFGDEIPLIRIGARELLARRWPSSRNHLLVVVLGELPPVPPAQRALEAQPQSSWEFTEKIDGKW